MQSQVKPSFSRIWQRFAAKPPLDLAALRAMLEQSPEIAPGRIENVLSQQGKIIVVVQWPSHDTARRLDVQNHISQEIAGHTGLKAQIVFTGHADSQAALKAMPQPSGIGKVKKIIAVASGKGGVGKSTTAVNLAVSLSHLKKNYVPHPNPLPLAGEGSRSKASAGEGFRVGLLDCDIYGPSIPRMMGINQKPEIKDKKIIPLEKHGIKLMSMGFLVPEESANIWRGPMVMGAVQQMLNDVVWGDLDILIVDMPPGTGDAQLTLCQKAPLAGAVIVSTPQDIALIDARKAVAMFQKMNVPILGIIENMSYFQCPHCHERSDIFAHGGARAEAEKLGVKFLGEIPLDIQIRETSDKGLPIAFASPYYQAIAREIATISL